MCEIRLDEYEVLLRAIEQRAVYLPTAAEHSRDLFGIRIDLVDAVAAAGRRGHHDLAIVEPRDVARLILPRAEDVLRLTARGVDDEETAILKLRRGADEGDALAIGRPLEIRLVARVFELAWRTGRGVLLAVRHRDDEDLGVVARQLVALAIRRKLGDRVTLGGHGGVRPQFRVGEERDPFAVGRYRRFAARVVRVRERLRRSAGTCDLDL